MDSMDSIDSTDRLSGNLVMGIESASTGPMISSAGNSNGSSCIGLSCAQLDLVPETNALGPVICRDIGDKSVDAGPMVLVVPVPSTSGTFEEGSAERGEGHHDPNVPAPCESGDGHCVGWPCVRPSCNSYCCSWLASSLGALGVPRPRDCDHDRQTCGAAGPGCDGVGGTTLAPNTTASYPSGPAGLLAPGVIDPESSRGLSPRPASPSRAVASRAFCSSILSLRRFLIMMIRHTTQAITKAPAMLDVMAPILALAVIPPNSSSSSSSSSESPSSSVSEGPDVDVAAVAPALVLVLVVVYVVKNPALVVVMVLVTVVVSFEAARKAAWDMLKGVFVSEQLCSMRLYTCPTTVPSFPMHAAEAMTKFPVLLQRHLFISATVSPLQPESSAASLRHVLVCAG